ncbi:hypothetical protein C347_00578 [Cryptococcus neoformans AD2-60a]|nr:hypothetical protein C347_00578 [Cryptococcus neoformans var. grubii AD2-60a]OXC87170.1 hypothetical protein C344_00508 [Cryptococcus neoformans var. grubii AD1-7a]OXG40770.1 hypothetical protein C360_00551 [Cryptococcus neoformans var. grubii Bt15]OXG45434.1 hypothetical protein C359_00118 [Cryptococcus neoformans var. grubii Bt120]OXH39777.1 hypothetical protein J005_00506 [Cryptococcus neoformans var. grubii]
MWIHRYSPVAQFLLVLVLIPVNCWSLPPHLPKPQLPGKLVPFSRLHECPSLRPRVYPTVAKDVRPDDFRVIMALGDSITAGLLARGSRSSSASSAPSQVDRQRPLLPSLDIQEYRGLSYPIGSDPGAITIPEILRHFSPSAEEIPGSSKGKHPPVTCLNGWGIKGCAERPEEDGLNAAVSGSVSAGLLRQVEDFILPRLKDMEIRKEDWKFVNLGIGANDICSFCLYPNITDIDFSGSPKRFAKDIKHAVNALRKNVPNIIVNIIGLFRVSAIYKLTLKDPYCQPPLFPYPIPHFPLECSCALLPGPTGDWTRQKMDELGEAYDEAVLEIVREWEKEGDEHFGAIWQPGTAIDLPNYPITALSPIDCFHPSEASHQRMAAGIWNRLTLNLEEKYLPISWDDEIMVRCLEEDDRVSVGMTSESF